MVLGYSCMKYWSSYGRSKKGDFRHFDNMKIQEVEKNGARGKRTTQTGKKVYKNNKNNKKKRLTLYNNDRNKFPV